MKLVASVRGGTVAMSAEIILKWPGGQTTVPQQPSVTLLQAALAHGVPVAHSCQRGDCRQCMARVVESADPKLTPGEFVELCRIPASTTGVFEFDDNPHQAAASIRLFPAKVGEITEVAANIVRLRIRIPPRKAFEFRGGQFASLTLKHGLTRSYSIASANNATGEVDFFVKIVAGGAFGRWLLDGASPGDMLQMRAPMGAFTLRAIPAHASWFIATGTGIVPILAMLRNAQREHIAQLGRVSVLWGNRSREDLFCEKYLSELCDGLGIDLRTVFSRDTGEGAGRVTELLTRAELKDSAIYAAGHPEMIKNIKEIWVGTKSSAGGLFSDAFAFSDRQQAQRAAE